MPARVAARVAARAAAKAAAPTGETLVDDALTSMPGAIGVFLGRRMHCVGCPVNRLHALADAAREHRIPLADLIDELGGRPFGHL